MLLPEGVPPPVRLQSAETEVGLPRPGLELPHQVDHRAVAELLLVVAAEGDHLGLSLQVEVHLGQDAQSVLVSLTEEAVKQNLATQI